MTYMSYINISIYADRRGYIDQTLRSAVSVLVCFTLESLKIFRLSSLTQRPGKKYYFQVEIVRF